MSGNPAEDSLKRSRSPVEDAASKKVKQEEDIPTSTAQAITSTTASAPTEPIASTVPVKQEETPVGMDISAEEEAFNEEEAMNMTTTTASVPSASANANANVNGNAKDYRRKHWSEKDQERRKKQKTEHAGKDEDVKDEEKEGGVGGARLPKKRAAVLVGFCGAGYSGMQIQADQETTKTIEGDLWSALIKAGAVSDDNATDHRKVDLQRSARTDAGVHAAGNVVSLKLILDPPLPDGFKDLPEYINSFLPEQIRVWDVIRTVKSFMARTSCDSRIYEYLLPTYCLLPPASADPLAKQLDESSPGWRDVIDPEVIAFTEAAPAPPPQPTEVDGEATEGETEKAQHEDRLDPKARGEFERRRGWRADPGTVKRFRELVNKYLGTHNFHNYTVGKPFNDRTVKRYMIEIDVKDPQVYGDIEWISVQIHGQSFMLHQIRKMMAMAMLACRTGTPASLLPETFGPKKIHIPKAPPLGLLLEAPQFKTYNERTIKNAHADDRQRIEFTKYAEKIHAFKVKYIYEKLREDELQTNVFHKWVRQVDCTAGDQFSFLNTKGVIPPQAEMSGQKGREKKNKAEEGGDATTTDGEAAKSNGNGLLTREEIESEDEDVDPEALKKGELEG